MTESAEFLRWKLETELYTEAILCQQRLLASGLSIAAIRDLALARALPPIDSPQIQALKAALARAKFRERAAKSRTAKGLSR